MTPAFFLEVAAKSSVLLLLAWSGTRVLARASASARHLVWAVALTGTLAMPAVVWLGISWPASHMVPAAWVARAGLALNTTWRGARRFTDGEVWPQTVTPRSHAPFTPESGQPRRESGRLAGSSSPVVQRPSVRVLGVVVWIIGTLGAFGSVIVGLLWATWLVRSASDASADWHASLTEALRIINLGTPVRVLISPRVGVPVVSGLIRPSLLLPTEASAWTADRRRIVLLHELAHVKRRDCLMQVIAQIAWAIHWWNPLMLIAVSRLRAEQERACDDLVLAGGTRPTDYADHLCDIASRMRRSAPPAMWATLAIARTPRLTVRIEAILDNARNRGTPSRAFSAALSIIGAAFVMSVGAMSVSIAASPNLTTLAAVPLSMQTPYIALLPGRTPERLQTTDILAEPMTAFAALSAPARRGAQAFTAEAGQTFLDAYCTKCHDSRTKVANLILEGFNPEAITDAPEIWEKVVRVLRIGLHPPGGIPRPSADVADGFRHSIEAALDRADQLHSIAPGPEPLVVRELAARVSAFLWNQEPDDTLLTLASSGRLRDPSALRQHVRRMLADSRSSGFLTGFFGDWLHLKQLAGVKRDQAAFPEFDDGLRDAFHRETELFLASQVREDRSVADLLTANYTFLNDRLAAHYGLPPITGSALRRVALTDDRRYGLLGQGSILSVTSFVDRTSPVLRGKYVLEVLLGGQLPPPPANVPALKNRGPENPATMRMRMEEHRKNPVCVSCHVTMDAVGFALENFDAVGRWRTTEADLPIDASVKLPDGSFIDGPAQLRDVLVQRREAMASTITLRLLAYALGRPARYSDMPTVRAILWDAASTQYTWSAIVAGVVKSPAFQTRALEVTQR
jgi:beta-lactamase regulating signal transducer with metallopeptidase domain